MQFEEDAPHNYTTDRDRDEEWVAEMQIWQNELTKHLELFVNNDDEMGIRG